MWPAFRMFGWSQLQGSALLCKSAGLLSCQHCSVSRESRLPPDLLSLSVSSALLCLSRESDLLSPAFLSEPCTLRQNYQQEGGRCDLVKRQIWFSTEPSVPAAVITIPAWTSFNFSSNIDFPPQEEKENQTCAGKSFRSWPWLLHHSGGLLKRAGLER